MVDRVSGEQIERGDVVGAHDGEVTMIECGDRSDRQALRQHHQRCVCSTKSEICVLQDQVGNASPIRVAQDVDTQHALGDRGEQGGFCRRSKLAIQQVGGLGNYQGCGDERPGVCLKQLPTCCVGGVVSVSGRQQRAGVNQQHSVPPEPFSEQFVGLARTTSRPGCTDGSEGQLASFRSRAEIGVAESRSKDFGGQLIDAHATPDGLDSELVCQRIGKPDDRGHRVIVDRQIIGWHVRKAASTRSQGGAPPSNAGRPRAGPVRCQGRCVGRVVRSAGWVAAWTSRSLARDTRV